MPPNSPSSGNSLKFRVGCLSTLLGFFIPLGLFFPLWIGDGFIHALTICVITFGILQTVSLISFALIQNLSWLGMAVPFFLGVAYSLLPAPFATQENHLSGLIGGAFLTYIFTRRKVHGLPLSVLLVMLCPAIYTYTGMALLAPLDKLLIGLISFAIALLGVAKTAIRNLQFNMVSNFMKQTMSRQNPTPPGDVIDVEAQDLNEKPKDKLE